MPELPEVETIKRGLKPLIVGKRISRIKILNPGSWQGNNQAVLGKKITAVLRRGKMLIIQLPNHLLAIHLKMTGQLIFKFKNRTAGNLKKMPDKYTRVIFAFTDNTQLYFNDLRKFGWIKVYKSELGKKQLTPSQIDKIMKLKLGPEPFGRQLTVKYLSQVFSKSQRSIKQLLLDQQKVAGIGNIYANEALFLAQIRPEKPANQLFKKEIKKLKSSIEAVLTKAINYKGTSSSDYVQPSGELGQYQNHFLIYQKQGKKCLKCGRIIKRVKLGGRSSFFCPYCQK
jgi:formamidopyrimidine-DNA glycosylase